MTWNHRDKLFALGVAYQPTPGTFVLPDSTTGIIGISSPQNGDQAVSAADPTMTGAIWEAPRIFMGLTGTGGGTIPLRGPGGASPPAANAWPVGLILQACGFTELRRASAQVATALQAGSTTTQLVLAASESSVDDFMIGTPIQHTAIGTGFRQTSLIMDYVGSTRAAILAETLGSTPTGNYVLPANLSYVLGTLTTDPPLLSLSVWRDKKRYDYRDCRITSWGLDMPVSNEGQTSFPSLEFAIKGVPVDPTDTTTPTLPQSILNVPVPPARGGKFFLDKVRLGHIGMKMNIALETGAASNQNQDLGQDGYDILSGTRTLDLTLNQMNVTDFDLNARIRAQTQLSLLSTWGSGSGNNMGFILPGLLLDPLVPGSTNGYVSLAGQAIPNQLDKGVGFSVWW